MVEKIKKDYQVKLVEILFYIFPLTFIIGSFALSVNLFLFVVSSLFLIKKKELDLRFNKTYWILIIFFSYLIVLTIIYFQENFDGFKESLEGFGYDENKKESLSLKESPIFKSLIFIRFLILVFVIDTLFFNKLINLKKFFISSLFCTSFVSIDILIQYAFGHDLFGLKNVNSGVNSGPFGDELIAGGYLQKFSFFSIFLIYEIFKEKNFGRLLPIILIVVHTTAMSVTGNRIPFFLFLFGCFIIFLIMKNFRIIMSLGIVISLSVIFILAKNDEGIQNQYFRLFNEINAFTLGKIIKIRENMSIPYGTDRLEIAENSKINKIGIIKDIINKGGGKMTSGHAGIWRSSIEIWKEQPLFGFGLRSFRFKCRELLSRAGNSNIITSKKTPAHMHNYDCSNHSHNYYLQLLVETGLVGISLIAIFIIIIFKNSFYLIKRYKRDENVEVFFLIPIVLVIFLEIWPLRSTGSFFSNWTATSFWLFISLLLAAKKNPKS